MRLKDALTAMADRPRAVTYVLLGVTVLAVVTKVSEYIRNPWTRDAQVRTHIVQVTPRVSGPVIRLPIKDNQKVSRGQLLFEIDPRTFTEQLNEAKARLDSTKDNIEALARQVEVAKANVKQSESEVALKKSSLRATQAQFKNTELNYERASFLIKNGSITERLMMMNQRLYLLRGHGLMKILRLFRKLRKIYCKQKPR